MTDYNPASFSSVPEGARRGTWDATGRPVWSPFDHLAPPPMGHADRPLPPQPDHSMYDEEPDGWDLAPSDIHDARWKRHPRKEGKGGTP